MTPEPETTALPGPEPGLRILALFGSVALFGAERGNIEALSALKACGAEILCLVSDERWNATVPPALETRGFICRRVPYVHLGRGLSGYNFLIGNPVRFVQANIAFWRAVRDFKPSHIHAYGQSFVLNFLIGLMLIRRPLVYRAGDVPTLHNWIWRTTWRYLLKRTSRFVSISRFVSDSIVKHGADALRVDVIYNAPTFRHASGVPIALPKNKKIISFIGQITEHKGPHLLLAAFRVVAREFPEANLVYAGRISDWEGDAWGRKFRDEVQSDTSISRRVLFTGLIENVYDLLERSLFLVVPSLCAEGLGNVIMESKQAGRAVVGFPRGGIPEVIEHGVDGLVCAEISVPALASALRQYLNDPALARRHGEAARLSLERLEIPHFGRKWRAVYRAATARPDGGAGAVARANIEEAQG